MDDENLGQEQAKSESPHPVRSVGMHTMILSTNANRLGI